MINHFARARILSRRKDCDLLVVRRTQNTRHGAESLQLRDGVLYSKQIHKERTDGNPRGICDSCAHSPTLFPLRNRTQPASGCSVGRNLLVKWRRMAQDALWGFVIEFLRRRFDWGINDRVTRSLFTRQVNARMTNVGSFHLHRFRRLMATQL